jgi:hypothetical protein
LARPSQLMPRVYFPVGAVVSLLTMMRDGSAMEIAMVGREGLVGIPVLLAGRPAEWCGPSLRSRARRCRQTPGSSGEQPGDRPGLEALACECYAVIRSAFGTIRTTGDQPDRRRLFDS